MCLLPSSTGVSQPRSTRSSWIALSISLIAICSSTVQAHLGEEHPPGQHNYTPEIERVEVPLFAEELQRGNGRWWTHAEPIPGRDGEIMISSRFQSMYIVADNAAQEYHRAGEDYRWSYEGMSSFTFHPGFDDEQSPGYAKFYTLTTDTDISKTPDFGWGEDDLFHNVLTEWTVNDIGASSFEGTSRELMRFGQSALVHNVNDLKFADDGTMFIATGESANNDASARLDNPYGKILRIDPLGSNSLNGQYGIPADNPFVGQEGVAEEVYAYGMRNPWRIFYDQPTDSLWAFDVGWRSLEEVDLIEPGGNYGWPEKEGSFLAGNEALPDVPDEETGLTVGQTQGYIEPVMEYDHLQGVSISGGIVYRGEMFPWLQGKVIFGEVGIGAVVTPGPRVFAGDPETGVITELIGADTLDHFWDKSCNYQNEKVSCPVYSVSEDEDGEILVLGLTMLRITSLPADFDNDGILSAADIDMLTEQVAAGTNDLRFDVDQDGDVDNDDRVMWVEGRKLTYFGDSNLDGEFNSADLVASFQTGEYEDGVPLNSSWVTGDWNGDSEFDSADFVLAFQSGSYEQGPRGPANTVPEPSSLAMLLVGLVLLRRR